MRFAKALLLSSLLVLPVVAEPKIPRQAPEFAVMLPQGGQQLLSQHRGKVVVLEFLYTTCVHCQNSARLLTRLQNEYGPRGLQVVGVGFNDMAKMLVPDFARTFGTNFPVGFSTREPVQAFLQIPADEMVHVPQLVLIDRKGMIRHQSLPRGDAQTGTESFLRANIEKLLAESTAGATKTSSKPAGAKTQKKTT
ncbi:MAG TPA: TlpA disulfide reductase family protein [Bryobacteraceae bacterium]|nr:TlpA disulfide reductase family protein [Bryobacteraceae bacterium]